MRTVLSVLFSLAAVLLLVFVTIYATKLLMKKFNVGGGFMGMGSGIEVIACRGISADKSLMAVKAGEKCFLLAVTAGDIKVLTELSDTDIEIMRAADSTASQGSFGEILAKNFREKFGAEKNTPDDSGKDGKL